MNIMLQINVLPLSSEFSSRLKQLRDTQTRERVREREREWERERERQTDRLRQIYYTGEHTEKYREATIAIGKRKVILRNNIYNETYFTINNCMSCWSRLITKLLTKIRLLRIYIGCIYALIQSVGMGGLVMKKGGMNLMPAFPNTFGCMAFLCITRIWIPAALVCNDSVNYRWS